MQKWLPVVVSIVIIVVVALLRERSRTLAAILATMPINMVLALWIVLGAPDVNPQTMQSFVRSLLVGLVPTIVWLVVIDLGLRGGWSLVGSIAVGYTVWGGLIAIAFRLGFLSFNR